jgi:hypothetical protein
MIELIIKNYKLIILLVIVFIAGFFRLYRLDQIPPSASLDEVTIGWNAYSITKTGADEYGSRLPLLLRAYDDWRPALYVYTVIPFISIFGLTAFAVRLPSVLMSLVLVFISFYIGRDAYVLIWNKQKGRSDIAGYLTATLVAISPWQIYLSRLGHEANLGLLFTAFGTYFLLKNLNTKLFSAILLSGICYVLSMYSYQSQKLIIPVILIFSGLIYAKHWFIYGKKLLVAIILIVILMIPLIMTTFSKNGLVRLSGTSAFSLDQPIYQHARIQYLEAIQNRNLIGKIYYSPKMTGLKIIFSNYLSHFNPLWLFAGRDYEFHKVPFMGLLYFWEFPFILIGLFMLLKLVRVKPVQLILVIFLTSPLAASITTQAPHAMRSYTFIPLIQLITAFGLMGILPYLKTNYVRIGVSSLFFLLVVVGIRQLWNGYYVVFPVLQSKSFQFSLAKSIVYVNSNSFRYDRIIFSNSDNLYQSYMFYLFFSKYDPELYQKYGGTGSGGFAETHKFGKFEFRPIDMEKEKPGKNILYVMNNSEFKGQGIIQQTFSNPDGSGTIIAAQKVN